jgi:pimeloyl-ACP methyl ester carboxylesterase
VGHSQGGFVSLEAALATPERVAGLILVDTAPGRPPAEAEAQLREMADLWCGAGPVGPIAQGLAELQMGAIPETAGWIARWQSRPPAAWRDPWTTVIDGHRGVRDSLGEITCPALVVRGALDEGFEAGAREFAEGLPGHLGTVEIAGAYHAPPLTHPGEVADSVHRFLREARPTTTA